ncbi:hypothetical protein CAPTEDRAFT_211104 [Capitella teleta]|uniref:Uncharacterized protein n=1 Tax=Capitella teleta TaxID=283909 RepID=R7TW65_CAPTE|nr:hypothetical protein CAPTEDRAFT_211104 [Capitella teleta]|eukprot:ELT95235.1 hypothetical protein CAPTEDRAFT_211104 [Capitella teleta]
MAADYLVRERDARAKLNAKKNFDRRNSAKDLPHLEEGQRVLVMDKTRQQPAVVVGDHNAPRSVVVETSTGLLRRNRRHLAELPPETPLQPAPLEEPPQPLPPAPLAGNASLTWNAPLVRNAPPVKTRSGRLVKPVQRLDL